MHIIKKISSIVSILIICLLGIYVMMMNISPDKVNEFIGYQFCNILTGSMEPLIPTNSLVLVKTIDKEEVIEPGTIITFRADRFNEEVLVTHYFDHVEEIDGAPFYRTHAYGVDQLDEFKTTREDIVGTYVFHVPYIGNFILFLRSPNAFVMYALYAVIFFLYTLFSQYLDKKEKKDDL